RLAEAIEQLTANAPGAGLVALEQEQQRIFVPVLDRIGREAAKRPREVFSGEVPQPQPAIQPAAMEPDLREVRAELDRAVVHGLGLAPLPKHGVLLGE